MLTSTAPSNCWCSTAALLRIDGSSPIGPARHRLDPIRQRETAMRCKAQHCLNRCLRTLDALQLAVALGLHGASPLDAFVCADANLCHVAAAEGLVVVNPELP